MLISDFLFVFGRIEFQPIYDCRSSATPGKCRAAGGNRSEMIGKRVFRRFSFGETCKQTDIVFEKVDVGPSDRQYKNTDVDSPEQIRFRVKDAILLCALVDVNCMIGHWTRNLVQCSVESCITHTFTTQCGILPPARPRIHPARPSGIGV